MEEIEHHAFAGVSLVLDARNFPVLAARSAGVMTVESAKATANFIQRMAVRAAERDTKVVFVGDSTLLTRKPTAEVRSFVAQAIDSIDKQSPGRLLGVVIIVDSALMRGVISMLLWLLRRKVRLTTAPNIAAAITRAHEMLDAAGVATGSLVAPADYEQPLFPEEQLAEVSGGWQH